MENEINLTGHCFSIVYEGVEYEVSTDVCYEVMLFDGSITPSPSDNGHTPMEISNFVESAIASGGVIGLDI